MTLVGFPTGTLWIDEIPSLSQQESEDVIFFRLNKAPIFERRALRLCFQVKRHHMYGLLGFDFTPDRSGQLRVDVHITNRDLDVNKVGLSGELALVVLNEARRLLLEDNVLGSGHLAFCYAVEHPVDSHPRVFRLLTRILFTLMTRDLTFTDDEKQTFMLDEMRKLV